MTYGTWLKMLVSMNRIALRYPKHITEDYSIEWCNATFVWAAIESYRLGFEDGRNKLSNRVLEDLKYTERVTPHENIIDPSEETP